jgi:hypothetical protein
MSTAVMPASRSVTALAKVEMLRLAKHPVFVIGFTANAYFLATALGRSEDYYNPAIIPAFFIGVFGMIAMFRLTRSTEKLEDAVGSTPAGIQDRVRALCAAAVLPGLVGVASFVVLLVGSEAAAPWAYGTFDSADRVGIFLSEVVVACVGGPLLGVAAARWLRFPGAVVVPVIAMLFVVLLGEGMSDAHPQATWSTALRMVSPWTQFTTVNTTDDRLGSWSGQPWFYLAWTVALCALAVLGALLKGAEAEQRRRLLNLGLGVGVVGLVFVVLAVALGPDATLRTSEGVSVLTGGAVGG